MFDTIQYNVKNMLLPVTKENIEIFNNPNCKQT